MDQSTQQSDQIAQAFWRAASANSEAGGNTASGMVGPGRWNLCARAVRQTHDPVRLTALASGMDHFESSFPKWNRVCDRNLLGRITKSIRSVGCVAHIEERPPGKPFSSIQTTYSCAGAQMAECEARARHQQPALLMVEAKAASSMRFRCYCHSLLE